MAAKKPAPKKKAQPVKPGSSEKNMPPWMTSAKKGQAKKAAGRKGGK